MTLQPVSSSAHYIRGRVLLAKGDVDSALKDFQAAVAYDPQFAQGYLGLGLADLARGQKDDGISNLRKASALYPDLEEATWAVREASGQP